MLRFLLIALLFSPWATGCGSGGDETSAVDAAVGAPPTERPPDPAGLDVDGLGERPQIDWRAPIPPGTHRGDVFGLGERLPDVVAEGRRWLDTWPVTETGALLPWRLTQAALDPDTEDETLRRLRAGAAPLVGFDTVPGFFDWLGLPPYPAGIEPAGPPDYDGRWPMGAGLVETPAGPALTFGCTACHAGRLLGRTVVGLANRQARANAFFDVSRQFLPLLTTDFVLDALDASEAERALARRSAEAAASVGSRRPQAVGLDSAVAHMSLSLARRGDDPWAEPSAARRIRPEETPLATLVADVKARPWWTTKYKTRWTADGSNRGHPIVINILWNEIGRGTDLRAFGRWLEDNGAIVDAMTAAVLATPAPLWTDFFPAESIDLAAARRGQAEFARRCAACHGTYEKAWDAIDGMHGMGAIERLRTTRIVYHAETPVFDVGTDDQRARAIETFARQVGRLALLERYGIETTPTGGYVPPPLEGIWARYPYLHNGSVPTLCALLTAPEQRPPSFRMGPSEDAATDFDAGCVGYPVGDAMPDDWRAIDDSLVDTRIPGLSNRGHASMIDGTDGNPPLTAEGRADLVMFLKTL